MKVAVGISVSIGAVVGVEIKGSSVGAWVAVGTEVRVESARASPSGLFQLVAITMPAVASATPMTPRTIRSVFFLLVIVFSGGAL